MKKRNPLAVVALTFVTFTVYAYYWLYQTTAELRDTTGRRDLSPAADVLLTLLTFGAWGIWAAYRNSKIAHEELEARGEEHSDRSIAVGAFAAASVISGWAWLVSLALLQDDFNRLAPEPVVRTHPRGQPRTRAVYHNGKELFEPRRAPSQVRVDVEPEPFEHPSADEVSAWQSAPSAPVFISNAPAPVVY